MFTTISELNVTLNSLVLFPGTSVDSTGLVVKSTLAIKSVSLPVAFVSVTVLVLAFTVTIRLSLDELSLVEIFRLEHLLCVTCGETIFPVTVVVATFLVGKFAFTVIEVVLETAFIQISIIFPAFARTIALTALELCFSDITVFIGHFTPSSHATVKELTNIGLLGLSFLEGVGTLAIEFVVSHLADVLVALKFTRGVGECTISASFTVNKLSFIPASLSLKSSFV
mmetsp:Transcript_113847/g.157647  ORF Transcript_113847/g.157647 Transcript_113847/m.157647 type:complete len:226 (-) Transcript_113847:1808-2485(-)